MGHLFELQFEKMAVSRAAPILASASQSLSPWGNAVSPLPLPIGRGALPEGAWLRLVAQLDWSSCRALNSTGADARLGTQAALATLSDARRRGQEAVTTAMAAFEEEARQNNAAGQQEQNAAAEALAHLAPLRNNGTLNQRYAPQIQEIFAQLEAVTRGPNREAELAAARQQRQEEAAEARRSLENEARLQIQEGHISAFFAPLSAPQSNSSQLVHLSASFGHAPLDWAQSSSTQEGDLSATPAEASLNEPQSLNEQQSSSSQEVHLSASLGHAPLDEAQSSSTQEGHLSAALAQAPPNEPQSLNEPQSSSSQEAHPSDLDDIIAIRRQRWLASQQSNGRQQ